MLGCIDRNLHLDKLEGGVVHLGLKKGNIGRGIVRSIRFSANNVRGVIKGGHAIGLDEY